MSDVRLEHKKMDELYDFAQLVIRVLELYNDLRAKTTRDLLLGELHQRLRQLNGVTLLKSVRSHVILLNRILRELPLRPEYSEAGMVCAERLMLAIEQSKFAQATHDDKE